MGVTATLQSLTDWLSAVDSLPLECDGASRLISAMLAREGIQHQVHIGTLAVADVGAIQLHWWIVLHDGQHCDFRARMWLGAAAGVPHGVFVPNADQAYVTRSILQPDQVAIPAALFGLMTGVDFDCMPRWS